MALLHRLCGAECRFPTIHLALLRRSKSQYVRDSRGGPPADLTSQTAGLSLDEIDRVFVLKHAEGSTLTYKQATEQAKEQLEIERLEISARPEKSGVGTDHVESVA